MPLVFGGFNTDVSPLLDQQRYNEEQLRRAALEAQQRNDQQSAHTASAGVANFDFHRQQDAIARQMDAQNYARQQDALAQQQHQLAFNRQGDWHNEDIARQTAQDTWNKDKHTEQIDWQKARHAEDLDFRRTEAEQRALEFTQRQALNKASMEDRNTFRTEDQERRAKLDVEHREAPYRREIERFAPEADTDAAETFVKRKTGQDKTPFSPTPDSPEWRSPLPPDPASALRDDIAARRGFNDKLNREKLDFAKERNTQIRAESAAHVAHQKQLDWQRDNPQRFNELVLEARKQVEPLLPKADPYSAYEFAKSIGVPLPPGTNEFQDREMKVLADDIAAKMIPDGTKEAAWERKYTGKHTTNEIMAAANRIIKSSGGTPPAVRVAPVQPAPRTVIEAKNINATPTPTTEYITPVEGQSGLGVPSAALTPATNTFMPASEKRLSPEEAALLPIGTEFIDMNGNRRTRK